MKNSIQKQLEIQSEIGTRLQTPNGKLLLRLSNIISWMQNDSVVLILPAVTLGEKRKRQLSLEMALRRC